MLIKWSDSYKIGVIEIDKQHEKLFQIVNDFFDAAQEGKSREAIGEMFDFLGSYVVEHFNTEEQIQQKYNYPKYSEHKKEHEDFIKTYKELKESYEQNSSSLLNVLRTNKAIADWLKKHVTKVDKELGYYINNQ